jgi:hypothetical protein
MRSDDIHSSTGNVNQYQHDISDSNGPYFGVVIVEAFTEYPEEEKERKLSFLYSYMVN